MKSKLLILILGFICIACEVQEPIKPIPLEYKYSQGANKLATGSSFYPVYIPIIKTYGK